jgi:hypothetical protein
MPDNRELKFTITETLKGDLCQTCIGSKHPGMNLTKDKVNYNRDSYLGYNFVEYWVECTECKGTGKMDKVKIHKDLSFNELIKFMGTFGYKLMLV